MEDPFRFLCQPPTTGLGKQASHHVIRTPDLPRANTDVGLVHPDMIDDAIYLLDVVEIALELISIVMIAKADEAMITVNAALLVDEDEHPLHLGTRRSHHQAPKMYQKIPVCPRVI